MKPFFSALFAFLLISSHTLADAPNNFSAAKVVAKQHIFFDQASGVQGDLYCGCRWEWVGRSGGRIDAKSCGYETRAQQTRAERIEWEHIVPAWTFGHQLQCWQNGGRKNCIANDPVFRAMEADLFNLYPSVGEVNADRSNFQLGMVSGVSPQYGACPTKVDFKGRTAEPRDQVKGLVARVSFYMHDRYGLNMSRQQQQLLMAWNRQYPVSTWEKEWNKRTAKAMDHPNPFVSGERSWTLGYTPSRQRTVTPIPGASRTSVSAASAAVNNGIIGNQNSKIYHLSQGCPSYSQVSAKNRVPFKSETEAASAGYRKAGNCR
jgi:deoxyribonuclease-1